MRFFFLFLIALLSAGSAFAAMPGKELSALKTFTTRIDDIDRRYHVYVPPGYNPARAVPLVFVLHGGGGDGKKMHDSSDIHEIAAREGFLVVYPDGATRRKDGIDTWDIGRPEIAENSRDEQWDDIAFMRRIIDETGEAFNIDDARIYVTGISRGGMFAYRVACEMSDVIAAIAPIAGAMEIERQHCRPVAPVPVLHIHGTEEENVPFGGGSGRLTKNEWSPVMPGLDFWKTHNGCGDDKKVAYDAADTTCIAYRDCRPGGEVSFCLVGRHGHGWPGRPPMRWHRENGVPINADFRAGEMIWAFFARNRREDAAKPFTVSTPANRAAPDAARHR